MSVSWLLLTSHPLSSLFFRFVSAASIDDYSSSGDSSFTTDDLGKPPALRMPRRSNRLGTSPSFSGSDYNLSSSVGNDTSRTMFRRKSFVADHRAASCSDLVLRFEAEEEARRQAHKTHQLVSLEA